MVNRKQQVKRYEDWKRNFATASTFVIICGLIAAFYFLYRIFLIASPIAAIEQSIFNPPVNIQVVCQEDGAAKIQDPKPLVSSAYQARIMQQKAISENGVTNPDLSQVDSQTGNPIGYSHTLDDADTSYQYIVEPETGTKFVRVTNLKKRDSGQILPAWQMDTVPLGGKAKTYAYRFSYRSTVPVQVSIEYTIGDKTNYREIATLESTGANWKQFAADFDNIETANTLRFNVTGIGVGQVDSKDHDIHEIRDAQLSQGIVTVAFDDGWESVNEKGIDLFDKYNIKTTQYIISETAEYKVPEYMNYDAITKLKNKGHEIGSHTLNHCNQTELTASVLENNALKSKQSLEAKNLGPIKSFAYPLGQYNKDTQAVYEKYYPLIRTSDAGYNDRYFDETNVHSFGILSSTSDKEIRDWLAYAKTHHLWVVLVYHRVDESGIYNVNSDQLERQLKIVNESGLRVATMSDAATLARK